MATTFSLVGTYDGSVEVDVDYTCSINKGNYAYIGATDGFWIVNISNPTAPTLVSRSATGELDAILNVQGIAVSADENTLYVASQSYGKSGPSITVVDITDKANPVLGSGTIGISTVNADYTGFVSNNQAIVLTDVNTLFANIVFDDGITPSEVAQGFDVSGAPTGIANPIGFDYKNVADFIVKIANNGTVLYCAILDSGANEMRVEQYNVASPSSPSLTATSDTATDIGGITVALATNGVNANLAYTLVPNSVDGLFVIRVYDFSESNTPSSFTTDLITTNNLGQIAAVDSAGGSILVAVTFKNPGDGETVAWDVDDPDAIAKIQTTIQNGSSVSFAYPYFYSTNANEEEANSNQLYSWLIDTGAEGWSYGSNNVIYTQP